MPTVEAVGWVGTFTGILLGLPQVVRLGRTRTDEGLSLPAWQALLAVNVAWTQHGLRIGQAPQVWTSALGLCSTVPILFLMSRALHRPLWRVMRPGLLTAAAMIAIDQTLGTAAYGTVAVVSAVWANSGRSLELVRAPRIIGSDRCSSCSRRSTRRYGARGRCSSPLPAARARWSRASAHFAADIPCSVGSSGPGVVARGCVFVVDGAGLQAAVEDADEAVAELA